MDKIGLCVRFVDWNLNDLCRLVKHMQQWIRCLAFRVWWKHAICSYEDTGDVHWPTLQACTVVHAVRRLLWSARLGFCLLRLIGALSSGSWLRTLPCVSGVEEESLGLRAFVWSSSLSSVPLLKRGSILRFLRLVLRRIFRPWRCEGSCWRVPCWASRHPWRSCCFGLGTRTSML